VTEDAHRGLRESLGAYALDLLGPHERLAVDAHLAGCADCRAVLAELRPAADALACADPDRVGTPVPQPPPGLAEVILERVRAERRRSWRRWARPAAAAAVAVAAGFGVGWWAHPSPPEVPLEPVAVLAADPAVRASADLVPHTWGVEVKLSGSGFAAGRVYRVFVTDSAGARVSAGEFIGTGQTPMVCNLNSSVPRADADGFEVVDGDGGRVLWSDF
jgi:anti-sigma factor RsiW